MDQFFYQFAERMALEATEHTDGHISRENAMLLATQTWRNKQRITLNKFSRAQALLLKIEDPDRVATQAANLNKSAIIWSDTIPSAWLNFNIREQATDFFVEDGRDGPHALEKAMNDAANAILQTENEPNPLCVRMRGVRLHLTQFGRAYHLRTSSDLEPHELELECREHMHSWDRHVYEFQRIACMAQIALQNKDWLAWVSNQNPFVDPPSLAFSKDDSPRNLPAPNEQDFFVLRYSEGEEPAQGTVIPQYEFSNDIHFFLGTHATDAESVYHATQQMRAGNALTLNGVISTAFEADGRILTAFVSRDILGIQSSELQDQALFSMIDSAAYHDSPLVQRKLIKARTKHSPETLCFILFRQNNKSPYQILRQQTPAFYAAKANVIQTIALQIANGTTENASVLFNNSSIERKATMLHAAGVIQQYQQQSTAYANSRGLKLAKRKLNQLVRLTAEV